ncbi:MAG: CoA transferase [Chloroflexota bacterium]
MPRLPLQGIRVADFSQVFAGPAATLWLAALGADVIKIENPAHPDNVRRANLGEDKKYHYSEDPRTAWFSPLNFGKKSCTLDLKSPEGQNIARDIVGVCDVVADNFATGVMERFGLGYDQIRKIRPDVVMLSVSGFGRTGPDRNYVAYATIATAFGGLNGLTGYEGGAPQIIGGAWGDLLAAKMGALLTLAALERRWRTGRGQFIDLSMSQVMVGLTPEAILDFTMNGRNRGPRGNRDDIMAPHNAYPCKGADAWAVIAVSNDKEWAALCGAIGKPELKKDPRFADQRQRWLNQAEIDPVIASWTRERTSQHAMETLQKAGVPAARSSKLEEIATDPHLKARGYFREMADYRAGRVTALRLPGTTDANSVLAPAPNIGEHNKYMFEEVLGLTAAHVESLKVKGITASAV